MANNPNNKDNLKPFKAGQSGNPAGLKPGTRHLSTLLKLALEKGVEVEVNRKNIVVTEAVLMQQVAKGIAKGSVRMIELVFDRIDGRATQPIDLSADITTHNELADKTVEELIQMRNNLSGNDSRRARRRARKAN